VFLTRASRDRYQCSGHKKPESLSGGLGVLSQTQPVGLSLLSLKSAPLLLDV